jgi:hypothetical protein
MDDLSKYYQMLGLKAGASPGEVRQAYRDMVKVWHPDRFAHDERLRVMAQDKLKEINGAYESLKAHAFESSIAPEPSAVPETETAAASPARNRAALWTTLGVLAFVLVAAAAFLFADKSHGKRAVVISETNAAVSLPPTNAPYALSFNGNHSRLAIATTGSLTGTFTVEFWALTRAATEGGTVLSSRTPDDCGLDIKFRVGKWFHTDIGNGSRWLAKSANARFRYKADTWYHIAYVATPTNYSIYINSKLEQTGPIDPPGNPLLYDANHHLCFGVEREDIDDFDGLLAEVRVWGTARTQTQIKSGMNQTLTGNEPGLTGYWRFAEGSGTVAADNSGHGFTGTLIGDVTWNKEMPSAFRR